MTRASFVLPDSLLSSLRYPHQDVHGMAAWGPDARTGRVHAWVKWDGKSISAQWVGAPTAGSVSEKLSVRWMVIEGNRLSPTPGQDSPTLLDGVVERFESIARTDRPSFIALPRPLRSGF